MKAPASVFIGIRGQENMIVLVQMVIIRMNWHGILDLLLVKSHITGITQTIPTKPPLHGLLEPLRLQVTTPLPPITGCPVDLY